MTTSDLDELVAARERFVAFARAKLGDAELAEDVVQASLLKAVQSIDSLADEQKLIPWFYTILRNAITDAYRSRGGHPPAVDIAEIDLADESDEDEGALCECFRALIPTLPPQYADLIQRLDLEKQPSAAVQRDLAVTAGNLKVRHHRARQALRTKLEATCRTCAEHHCLDCTCKVGP
ncbi:MAG: RNA polymerase sigma factor [Dehalococcoidia bacterium]